jgi:hypothetical protein
MQSFSVRTITDFIPDISLHTLPAVWPRTVHDTHVHIGICCTEGLQPIYHPIRAYCTPSREMDALDFLGSR